jgi:hypothetical protein
MNGDNLETVALIWWESTCLEGAGAAEVQVADASGSAAVASAADGVHGDGQVVAIHQAHIVEVVVVRPVERDLRQRRRRGAPGAVALEHAPTVPRLTRPLPRRIEHTP